MGFGFVVLARSVSLPPDFSPSRLFLTHICVCVCVRVQVQWCECQCTCVRACVCVCAQHVQYFMVSLTGKMGAKQTDTENRKEHKWYTEKNSYFLLKNTLIRFLELSVTRWEFE